MCVYDLKVVMVDKMKEMTADSVAENIMSESIPKEVLTYIDAHHTEVGYCSDEENETIVNNDDLNSLLDFTPKDQRDINNDLNKGMYDNRASSASGDEEDDTIITAPNTFHCNQTQNSELYLNQVFDDMEKFRRALRSYCIKPNFELRHIESRLRYIKVGCKHGDCPWMLSNMLATKQKILRNRHPPPVLLGDPPLPSLSLYILPAAVPFSGNPTLFSHVLNRLQPRDLVLMGVSEPSRSSRLLQGVHGVNLVGQSTYGVEDTLHCGEFDFSNCGGSEIVGSSQSLVIGRIWKQRPACLRPIQCRLHGDQNIAETIANVVTSLPFIVLGLQAPKRSLSTALYANSLVGVGIASSLYHCSRGQARRFLRWADYTMIATTTVCLSRAIRNENPKLLMAASTLILPFQPFMVSAVHTGLMEVAFARRALTNPELRMAHNLHKMSSLLGGALFVADGFFAETPYIHAAWHLAAAIGVGTCNKLLE
ncbi:hypothetical protein Cni_G28868 [Canna indica]|uniref:Transposase MuDR plant domain-containing protein n=1 Tax=Canna indica TaxID=4628 RepID=A0AAQ3L837_9LILI|nr:hypothetical protein Cni_G28868 [Canna indica]